MLTIGLLTTTQAFAQGLLPGPPGPYVIDVRGATSGLPCDQLPPSPKGSGSRGRFTPKPTSLSSG